MNAKQLMVFVLVALSSKVGNGKLTGLTGNGKISLTWPYSTMNGLLSIRSRYYNACINRYHCSDESMNADLFTFGSSVLDFAPSPIWTFLEHKTT